MKSSKEYRFSFNRAQIILHLTFVIAISALGLFQVMPQIVAKYPPPQQKFQQSLLTPYLGRKRNAHDHQWQAFRSNLPLMVIMMFTWKYAIALIFPKDQNHKRLKSFWLGLGMLIFSYRADIILYLSVILVWFYFTKLFYKTQWIVPVSWAAVIVTLYLNEKYDHLRFISAWVEQYVPEFLSFFKNSKAPILWTNILNMSFLKMISFTMDCHWGEQTQEYIHHKSKCDSCSSSNLCYRGRDLVKLPEMSLKNYLDYILYAPTCLAGPPISFKSFHSFDSYPSSAASPVSKWLFMVVFFELWQHFYPVIRPQPGQTLIQMAVCSVLFLYFIFLKFSVIWKTGRMWSLLYGIDVIDNMSRCMFNNYGFERFWRMWHRGFNHWLIRYLYIPMGGNKSLISVFSVIVFVAFWHDHTIKIVLWGLILVLFMIPELAVKAFFRRHYMYLYPKFWFKYVCAFACAIQIQIICICNLIGFGYGFDSAQTVLTEIKNQWADEILLIFLSISGCILMFYIRDVEQPKRND